MKYQKLCDEIITKVGGRDNVLDVSHCITRLRFHLKDESLAQTNELKATKGVVDVIQAGGQYQVVIGATVEAVYNDLVQIGGFDSKPALDIDEGDDVKKGDPFSRLLAIISEILQPVLGVLMAGGFIKSMLALWDEQLIASAEKIIRKRIEAVRKLNMLANLMQRRISSDQENLTVSYEVHGGEDMTKGFASWYNEMLRKSQETDILRGSTSYGPHHDDLVLTVNGINLRTFGSQGQQRTGVLSLKLAELEFLRSETGEYPILLLDDVMSELDVKRRQQLLQFIRRERIQTLITATDAAYFPAEGMGRYYHVQSGQITT